MPPLPRVISAVYQGNFSIRVSFSDGLENTLDFRPWLTGPIFEPLHDEEVFKRFFVANSTVSWPNGADIAPETLYLAAASRQVA